MNKAASLLVLSMVLASCANERTNPTKATFAKVLQPHYEQNADEYQVCSEIPSPLSREVENWKPTAREKDWWKGYEVLKARGYVTITDKPAAEEGGDPSIEVKPTEKYQAVFGPPREQFGFFVSGPANIEVCYGHEEFGEVTDFTSPAESGGVTVSQVEYTTTRVVDDNKPWVKDTELLNAVGLRVSTGTKNNKVTLVLKDSGWSLR